MADRGNICVHYGDAFEGPRVYFYAHWHGSALPHIVANALDLRHARARWSDPVYLARIVFCELVKRADSAETGFGIAPYESDPENPTVHIWPARGVAWVDAGEVTNRWSFSTFIDKYK